VISCELIDDLNDFNELNDFNGCNHLINKLFANISFHALPYVLCGILAFLASNGRTQAAQPTTEIVAKIQQKYDQTHSLKADFVQKTRSRAASFGTSATGTLFFLKPRAIRWDYEQPEQQFVIQEDKAWLYIPDEKTVYLYDADQIINSPVVLSFFSGLGKLREMFSITSLPSRKQGHPCAIDWNCFPGDPIRPFPG